MRRVRRKNTGVSLLEVMLIVMLVAAGVLMAANQFFQYKRIKDITQIQQSVNQLLQAGAAYYYATCTPALLVTPQQVSLNILLAAGVLPSIEAVYNPRGLPFEVWIISGNGAQGSAASGPPYLIQVRAVFSDDTASIGEIAKLLAADAWAGGNQLTWTRLPSQTLKNVPLSVYSPGGWSPVSAETGLGGQSVSSNLWMMNGDLAKFSKEEAANMQKSGGQGFTCPN